MRRSLGILLLLMVSVRGLSQLQDCWIFIDSSITPSSLNEIPLFQNSLGYSKWFHAVAMEEVDASNFQSLSFVDSTICYTRALHSVILTSDTTDTLNLMDESTLDSAELRQSEILDDSSLTIPDPEDWELNENQLDTYEQIEMMQGYEWIREGYSGKGIRIAVLDAGFEGLMNDSAFQLLIREHRILDTYDFVKKDKDVFRYSNHGTQVLSCLAGVNSNEEDGMISQFGLAPGAEYLLARAEQSYSARLVKEVNFIHALEWAVDHGANIITSSLIFGEQLYRRSEMNGQSLISKAADKAFSMNVLVLNSAGNADNSNWEIIGAPSDAANVLAIGACAWNGLKSSFSSVGPSADGRIKPDLIARGNALVTANNELTMESGTSFACPLVAGFAACVWEKNKDWDAKHLREELIHSATLYPYYDYAHGFGIPQAGYFLWPDSVPAIETPTFRLDILSDQVVEVVMLGEFPADTLESKDEGEKMEEEIDRPESKDLLYVSLLDQYGKVVEYWTVDPEGSLGGMYDVSEVPGGTLKVYFKKYIQQINLR
jgi:Subtilase family